MAQTQIAKEIVHCAVAAKDFLVFRAVRADNLLRDLFFSLLSARREDGQCEFPLRDTVPPRGREPVKNYLFGVWKLRHFWLALVRIDLRNRYRRSMLGMGWSLLQPIAMTAVMCTVFHGLLGVDVATYGPYLLAGLTLWNFIAASVNGGCQSFFQNEAYIRQQPAPLAIYPLRTALGAAVHLLLGLVVFAVFWCVAHGPGCLWTLPALLPGIVLLFIFGWSLAILAGVMNVLFQDTQHLVEVLLQILFYLTPIMYRAGQIPQRQVRWIIGVNPLTSFLELIRQPVIDGHLPAAGAYGVAALTALTAAALATATLWRVERRMIFHL